MKEYKIIDAHAHIFPEKIAQKAVRSIGEFYDIPMCKNGSSGMLLLSGKKINVDKFLVCSTATKPEQVLSINDFVYEECQQNADKFIGFATLHPNMQNPEAEIERIIERGFKGVKLHPDFQEFNIDDEKMDRIYEKLQGKLFILMHTGDDRYDYSSPKRLAKVLNKFPDLKVIAAHFGGYMRWDEALQVYDGENIFIDTSSSLFTLQTEKAMRIIEKIAPKKVFFGTDYPMWDHEEELARFLKLPLQEDEKRDILYNNFAREFITK
ncbi:MAG: amidohydrolase family protein [Oscillospiraceae bacterium]